MAHRRVARLMESRGNLVRHIIDEKGHGPEDYEAQPAVTKARKAEPSEEREYQGSEPSPVEKKPRTHYFQGNPNPLGYYNEGIITKEQLPLMLNGMLLRRQVIESMTVNGEVIIREGADYDLEPIESERETRFRVLIKPPKDYNPDH